MKNSTAVAERLGEVDFHRLLNRFVSDLGSIVVQNGQIHKYVGDELIETWPLAVGLKDGSWGKREYDWQVLRELRDLSPCRWLVVLTGVTAHRHSNIMLALSCNECQR